MRSSQAGHAMVWAVVFTALLAVAISSIIIPKPAYHAWALLVFACSLAAGIGGLVYQARRDPYDACVAMIPISMIVMFVTGTAATFSEASRGVTGPIAAISLAAIAFCTVYVLVVRFGKDPLPNLLLEDHPKEDIRELEGVQFVARQSAEVIPVGGEIEIRVYAQNGWDTERTLTFRLVPLGWKKSEALLVDPAPSLTLPGGAGGLLSIPVRAGPGAPMSTTLLAKPMVSGRGGKHVRRWRAQAISTHIPDWFTILAGMAGWLVTGGGMKFLVVAAGDAASRPNYPSLPSATGTVTWKPEPSMLGARPER